jgi:hypothetical protein
MGDSTTRQVWSSLVSGFAGHIIFRWVTVRYVHLLTMVSVFCIGNNFERNAKEWTRENVSSLLSNVVVIIIVSYTYVLVLFGDCTVRETVSKSEGASCRSLVP